MFHEIQGLSFAALEIHHQPGSQERVGPVGIQKRGAFIVGQGGAIFFQLFVVATHPVGDEAMFRAPGLGQLQGGKGFFVSAQVLQEKRKMIGGVAQSGPNLFCLAALGQGLFQVAESAGPRRFVKVYLPQDLGPVERSPARHKSQDQQNGPGQPDRAAGPATYHCQDKNRGIDRQQRYDRLPVAGSREKRQQAQEIGTD